MKPVLIYLVAGLGAAVGLGLLLLPQEGPVSGTQPGAGAAQVAPAPGTATSDPTGTFAGQASATGSGIVSASTAAASAGIPQIERGVKYLPLDQQQLPQDWKQLLREQLRNLRETGSMSGGKVTHEFSLLGPMADNLRSKGIDKLRSQLAIQPSDLGRILGPAFHLVGADVQGKLVEGLGAAGFFQIQRNPTTGQMVELSENQLDVLGGDGTVITPEFQNETIGSFPATLERLVDRDGTPLHNLQWVAKDRTFQLTTRGMTADETRHVASAINQGFMGMPFDGWRKRYEYDPENPLHRTARPQATQRGRW